MIRALALSEVRILVRNPLVLATALLLPLVLGTLIASDGTDGSWGDVVAMQFVMVLLFCVYATATTSLAARRRQLVLKRLRSGELSDPQILAGLGRQHPGGAGDRGQEERGDGDLGQLGAGRERDRGERHRRRHHAPEHVGRDEHERVLRQRGAERDRAGDQQDGLQGGEDQQRREQAGEDLRVAELAAAQALEHELAPARRQ